MSSAVSIALATYLAGTWAQAAPDAPAGPAPTHATFVSTTSEAWDVVVDDQPMCATPCSGPLGPLQLVVLHSQEPNPLLLEVGRLPPGELVVTGKPLEAGKYAGGIVATTFGGMALVTGIALTAVGLAVGRGGMTTAGLISGAAGAVGVAGGIYLMLRADPSFSVERVGEIPSPGTATGFVPGASRSLAAGLGGRF